MSQFIAVRGPLVGAENAHRSALPPVDIFENADEFLVVADVPGAALESIDLRVENDTLTLESHRAAVSSETAPALSREYEEVDWSRTFRIPAGIDTGSVTAEAKNGTVFVKLPKAAASKPRKIAVKAS